MSHAMKEKSQVTNSDARAGWDDRSPTPSMRQVTLPSFRDFQTLITEDFNKTRRYVWRGQQCSDWKLESSLARRIEDKGKEDPPTDIAKRQLDRFKKAVRGRRGRNPAPLKDEELWALGQHFGLATPLLDWTLSPYVALYFAFADPDHKNQSSHRAVFGLNRPAVEDRAFDLGDEQNLKKSETVYFFEPDSDENSRVLSQRGLFTSSPVHTTIEDWVTENFQRPRTCALLKVLVPNSDRVECLRMLNRMNINHLTLFPDLIGAATFCNVHMDVTNY